MGGAVLSLFLLVTKRLYGKEREWSIGQIKTCRKKQHVKIDDMKELPDLICGKAAVGGNYNSTRDNKVISLKHRRSVLYMFIILFILFIGIPLLKESIENQNYRERRRRRGDKTYWSTDGLRYTNNNQKVYK